MNRRDVWAATKAMLSVKFAQGEIKLVDHFTLSSHKTKHVVQCFRRLVGDKCNSALCCHEGTRDINDEFRWATGHISAVRRCNVEGLDVYKLLKFKYLIITEAALQKLIYNLQKYPHKRGWLPVCATPNKQPAPVPIKVEGWNDVWKEKKERLRNSEFRHKLYTAERKKWKWSLELYGALKVKVNDPLEKFRLMNCGVDQTKTWEKLEDVYLDEEALGAQIDDEDSELQLGSMHDDSDGDQDPFLGLSRGRHSGVANIVNPNFLNTKQAVTGLNLQTGLR